MKIFIGCCPDFESFLNSFFTKFFQPNILYDSTTITQANDVTHLNVTNVEKSWFLPKYLNDILKCGFNYESKQVYILLQFTKDMQQDVGLILHLRKSVLTKQKLEVFVNDNQY